LVKYVSNYVSILLVIMLV